VLDRLASGADKPGVSLWLTLRFAKFVGMLALAMGAAIGLAPRTEPDGEQDRQRAVYWLATPGFLITWIAGWGMAKHTGASLGAPWISISMLASLVAMHELIRDVEPGRPRSKLRVAVVVLGLLVSVAVMVFRHGVLRHG
jgi:FtsH-binding integral membrane protein